METQTMVEKIFKKKKKLTKSWPLDWGGYFGHGIKWDAPSSFGLWGWPLEASHHARLKAPILIFLLTTFIPFLWTLNKFWLFNPTTS
jgi:hypothetical protein